VSIHFGLVDAAVRRHPERIWLVLIIVHWRCVLVAIFLFQTCISLVFDRHIRRQPCLSHPLQLQREVHSRPKYPPRTQERRAFNSVADVVVVSIVGSVIGRARRASDNIEKVGRRWRREKAEPNSTHDIREINVVQAYESTSNNIEVVRGEEGRRRYGEDSAFEYDGRMPERLLDDTLIQQNLP